MTSYIKNLICRLAVTLLSVAGKDLKDTSVLDDCIDLCNELKGYDSDDHEVLEVTEKGAKIF